jgi:hypothetical protein
VAANFSVILFATGARGLVDDRFYVNGCSLLIRQRGLVLFSGYEWYGPLKK